MKLAFAIIYLCAVSATPCFQPKKEIDRKYQQFFEMSCEHAESGPKYSLRIPTWCNSESADEDFKKECIDAFTECEPSKEWNTEDAGMCQTAYVTLAKQITIWNEPKYKLFLNMSYEHAEISPIYNLRIPMWCDSESADEDFKLKCIEAFTEKCGPSSKWESTNEKMCEIAYVTVIDQIGLYTASAKSKKLEFELKYQQFLEMSYNHAKNPEKTAPHDQSYNLHKDSIIYLKLADEDFKSKCIKAFTEKYGPVQEKWKKNDKTVCQAAYDILEEQIATFIDSIERLHSNWEKLLIRGRSDVYFLRFLGNWFREENERKKFNDNRRHPTKKSTILSKKNPSVLI